MIHLELTEREARSLLRQAELAEAAMEAIFDSPSLEPTPARRLVIGKLTAALERQGVEV